MSSSRKIAPQRGGGQLAACCSPRDYPLSVTRLFAFLFSLFLPRPAPAREAACHHRCSAYAFLPALSLSISITL